MVPKTIRISPPMTLKIVAFFSPVFGRLPTLLELVVFIVFFSTKLLFVLLLKEAILFEFSAIPGVSGVPGSIGIGHTSFSQIIKGSVLEDFIYFESAVNSSDFQVPVTLAAVTFKSLLKS